MPFLFTVWPLIFSKILKTEFEYYLCGEILTKVYKYIFDYREIFINELTPIKLNLRKQENIFNN